MKIWEQIITVVSSGLWVIFLIVTALQVLLRYVFGSPLQWTEEIARFSLIWFTFLGAILLSALDDHIRKNEL